MRLLVESTLLAAAILIVATMIYVGAVLIIEGVI